MAARRTQQTLGFVYYDAPGSGANPIAPFQLVALATAAEVTAAISAGVARAAIGSLVVPMTVGTVLSGTMCTRRCVGVTLNGAFSGDEVLVVTDGIADTMCNAAVTVDAMVSGAATTTRTTLQTPFTSMSELLLPFDPRASLTYNLALAGTPSLTYSSSGANVVYYPVGYAMGTASAQYDVIPVKLELGPLTG